MTSMSRVSVLESTSPSLTVKLTVRVNADGSSLVFSISDAAQRRFVVGQRVTAGQRQRARGRVPDARDRAGVGKRQHVFAIDVVAGDLNDGRFDVRVVQVGDRNRVGDLGGRIVLGVGDVGPFDRRFDRRIVDSA